VVVNGGVTAPKPPDAKDVLAACRALLGWLRANGHAKETTPRAIVLAAQNEPHRFPKDSLPGIVSSSLVVAALTASSGARDAEYKVLVELRAVRARTPKLLEALQELDDERVKRPIASGSRVFVKDGEAITQALDRLSRRLEGTEKRRIPATLAQWREFVAETSRALRNQEMSWQEIAALFPERGVSPENVIVHLKQRTVRVRSKDTQRRTGAPKRR
jgi:hypothetical protein